jgi:hypothetical protein
MGPLREEYGRGFSGALINPAQRHSPPTHPTRSRRSVFKRTHFSGLRSATYVPRPGIA